MRFNGRTDGLTDLCWLASLESDNPLGQVGEVLVLDATRKGAL